MAEAADRAGKALACRVPVADGLKVAAVVESANAAGAHTVVTAYAPV